MANLGVVKSATLVNGDVIQFQDGPIHDGTGNISVNKATIKYGNMLYTGTGTAGTAGSASVAYKPALWTFNTGMTPVAGDIITIKVPVAGVSSGVWMSVDNGAHYYPVATVNKTRLTTQYPIDNTVTLIYQTGLVTTTYGTSTSGAPAGSATTDLSSDRWCLVNGYDANTTYSAMTSANMINGTETTVRGMRADYLKTGLQGIIKATNGDVQLYGTHLTGQLPAPSSADNGKVARIVNGVWAAVSLPSASGVSF